MRQRTVFLVGFMGAGKSTVGRALSRRLGWQFEDLDEHIQARERRSIEAIFRDSGEAEFRRAERAALTDLLAAPSSLPMVVALGGGAFVQKEVAALVASTGSPTVFLDAPAEELWRRCNAEEVQRPLRRDWEQFQRLYEVRRPGYLQAGLLIDTDGKDVETVAAELASRLGLGEPEDLGKES